MDEQSDIIELRGEEIQEILTRPPHILIRYGTLSVCFVLSVLLIGSFLFHYPDTIRGDVLVTTNNPPVWVVAKSSGCISNLYCSDRQQVEEGDVLAVLENSANTDDVKLVKKLLVEYCRISDSLVFIPSSLISGSYKLGELQTSFSSFIKAVINYENFISLNLIEQDEQSLYDQIKSRDVYLSTLRTQIELKKKEAALLEVSYEREKDLFEKGIISRSEFEVVEQKYLNIQQSVQQLESTVVFEAVESSKQKSSMARFNVEYKQSLNNYYSDLRMAYLEMVAALNSWEQNYLLIAPRSGIVTLNDFWTTNQEVKAFDRVFAIIPLRNSVVVGKLKVPVSGAGRIKVGQEVNVKIDRYPYLEYGVLHGRVKNVSMIANEKFYTVEVELTFGLHSSTGIDFEFFGELNGVAEIVTENRSLGIRILSPLRYLLQNRF